MDSRFAHLRQRDTSVSMLRLDRLPEMEMSSLDAMSVIQEKTPNSAKSAKNKAGEERLKQLQRWKERKTLEKEKEMREKERKGVFKTGLYHPKDGLSIAPLPTVPAGSTRSKESLNTAASHSVRVTRSMKQQQVQKPLKTQNLNTATKKAQPAVERSTRSRVAPVKPAPAATRIKVCAVEPVVRAASTRSANRPPVTAPVVKDKPKGKPADARTTRSRVFVDHVAPPSDQEQNCKETENTVEPAVFKVPEMQEPEEDMVVDQAPADSIPAEGPVDAPPSLSSFAPMDFLFKAPTGLPSFKFDPLTPRSADAFLTPRSAPSPLLSPASLFQSSSPSTVEPEAELSGPSPPKSPRRSPPHTSPTIAPPTPGSLLETKHDVSYFRSEMSKETDALSALCVVWEPKVEDESIPEEMRDSIRTVVGQARLLMKQRFKQFGGLVDDCDLGRGEKITTCTDLQGFWDMVYYQVEDVYKKFEALKVAESQSWVEEHKPPPRQRKAVKKPSAAPAKPAGTKAAGAKSRLFAVKAAMKAKQQAAEAEKAAKDAGNDEENPSLDSQEPQPEAEPQPAAQVVFDGGFFQVESPARPSGGSVRRSSRLSAAPQPQASPSSNYLTPRRFTRRSLALSQTPVSTAASPSHTLQTPALLCLTLRETPAQTPKSQRGTPQASRDRNENVSLCFSPAKEVRSDDTRPEKSPAHPAVSMQENTAAVPELSTPTPVRSLPTISVVMEQEEPSEAVDPASTSPPPAVEASESVCQTPDASVVEEIPGLDFERYLQPSLRCSLSPQATVAVETLSSMAVDVEMESPGGPSEDLPSQREPASPGVSSMLFLQSPQTQTAECDMLLFTPDMKERIRQSVCPSDLMVFTPPSNV
ncbi:Disks large-associated protein 5 [Dissostichus eleginoides]|uniref:Disks large-associated protein 5 n=1 Tax=Dissostichus eleginoides TaxID=100907 RepID=A0AAD9F1A8_DISEL|nr:Disks large-associated protein 5 [Dissostichus eleginoides]